MSSPAPDSWRWYSAMLRSASGLVSVAIRLAASLASAAGKGRLLVS
ncbi:MAG TPA: hypothetical protein VJ777_05185 [Mycobacterium sp.]|nr:hypothetical protein [Mycobacterium sp.]